MRGKFITIEGIEGAGKSTASTYIQNYLAKHLQKGEDSVVVTREPGGTPFAETLRNLLLHTETQETIQAETETLIFFAGRVQHITQHIAPALAAGRWVLSDRFIDATYAYQGSGRGVDQHKIQLLDEWIVAKLYPDLTLLLDLPAPLGLARTAARNSVKDRIEQEKVDFFIRVRECYLDRAKKDPKRIKVVDASQSLASVQKQITIILDEFIAEG